MMAQIAVLLLLAASTKAQNVCSLPISATSFGETVSNSSMTAIISGGVVAGVSSSTNNFTLNVGPQYISRGAYECFMSTGIPLAVTAVPGSPATEINVPNTNQQMTLEWTASLSTLTVTYSVFMSTQSSSLALVTSGLSALSYIASGLSFNQPYYWQILTTDPFGRAAASPTYEFSIVPNISHMIAAPNPFHPGSGTTTFLFSMPGTGSADFDIYSLPDQRLVYSTNVGNLQNGMNTWVYDGRSSRGGYLPNGVFTVRIVKHGAYGTSTELFKIVVVR